MRVKTGTVRHHKHKKILEAMKGARMSIHKRIRGASQAQLHAGEYAFAGRKLRKRDFRSLWIIRINGQLKQFNISYSLFINKLKKANILLNRKVLADLALNSPDAFKAVVEKVNSFTTH